MYASYRTAYPSGRSSRFTEVSTMYFFFSSRRRHTRFDCDWSSDVCSSVLGHLVGRVTGMQKAAEAAGDAADKVAGAAKAAKGTAEGKAKRSEERRVGKESTPRRPASEHKKKS